MADRDLLDHLSAPLLEESVAGRSLPIVGAGFSRNAETESGVAVPDWAQLGAELGRDLPDQYGRGEALEVISACEHRYGRTAMTTRVARALQLGRARPGEVHEAFAALPFEDVVTTNIEQLLEDAYRQCD